VNNIYNTATVELFKLGHVLMYMRMKGNIYNHLWNTITESSPSLIKTRFHVTHIANVGTALNQHVYFYIYLWFY